MNFLNIAVFLAATVTSSVSADAASLDAIEASLKDLTTALKVNPAVLMGGESNFYSKIISICHNRPGNKSYNYPDCKKSYDALKNHMYAARSTAFGTLRKEGKAVEDVSSSFNSNYNEANLLSQWSSDVLSAEKQDWESLMDAVEWMSDGIAGTSALAGRLGAAQEQIGHVNDILKQVTEKKKPLKNIIGIGKIYNNFVKNFKRWVIAVKLFDNPAGESPTLNASNFMAPKPSEIDRIIRSLNVPADRFKVGPIEPTLNLDYLMGTEGGSKDFSAAVAALKANFDQFKLQFSKTNLAQDVGVRKSVVIKLFENTQNFDQVTLEVVKMRVKAYKRLVEGVIRSMQVGDPIDRDLATKVVKSWIMAVQMVDKDAWKNESVPFGVLDLPEGITLNITGTAPTPTESAPVTQTEKIKTDTVNELNPKAVAPGVAAKTDEERPHSDSVTSNESTGSKSSTGVKGFFSKLFHF